MDLLNKITISILGANSTAIFKVCFDDKDVKSLEKSVWVLEVHIEKEMEKK